MVPVFTVKTPGDDSVAVNEAVEHNALWDEMTAREGREAARRAGMKTGDWQAERQLQEALRESRRVSRAVPPDLNRRGRDPGITDRFPRAEGFSFPTLWLFVLDARSVSPSRC